jgi:hypothetical protein
MSKFDRRLKRRLARAYAEHRCTICGERLPPRTPESVAEAHAQDFRDGMTAEQIDNPEQTGVLCEGCYEKVRAWHEGLDA